MNVQQLARLRREFKLIVHESEGQAFEDLFVAIMQHANPNFIPVKKLFKNEIWLPFDHSGHDGAVAPSGRLVHPLLASSKEGDDDGTITV